MSTGDHYTKNAIIMQQFIENSTYPILFLYSVPFFATKSGLKQTIETIEQSIGYHVCIGIEGNHYFHMIQLEKILKIVQNCLKENLEASNGVEILKAKL
jgi:hypothetical protein